MDRPVVVPSDLTVNGERVREGVQFLARADPEDGLAYAVAVVVRCRKRRVVGEPDDHPRPFLEPVDGLGVAARLQREPEVVVERDGGVDVVCAVDDAFH